MQYIRVFVDKQVYACYGEDPSKLLPAALVPADVIPRLCVTLKNCQNRSMAHLASYTTLIYSTFNNNLCFCCFRYS